MNWIAFLAAFVLGMAVPPSLRADDDAVRRELAPTGKLRVAIAVAPSPSAFWAVKDSATGEIKGVTVTLGAALARKLGVIVDYVIHASSGDIVKAAESGAWDVTFVPADAERKKLLDFGNAYHLL